MNLQEAQQKFNEILINIKTDKSLSRERRNEFKQDLKNLRGQLEVLPETLPLHDMINKTISDLTDANIDELTDNIDARTGTLSAAKGGLREVIEHTNKVANALDLKWATRLIETAKNVCDKVESIRDAIDSGDASQISDSINAALVYIESEKAKAEAEATEAGGK